MKQTNGDAGYFTPQYDGMDPGDLYGNELDIEYIQCVDEGLDIHAYRELFAAADALPAGEARETIADGIFRLIRSLPRREDYPYAEPSDLQGIRELRDGSAHAPVQTHVTRDALSGAWYGRIIGCLLGKTLEGIRSEELLPLLRQSGNWPMHRYVRSDDPTPQMLETFRFDLRNRVYADRIECAPADDDTNYTVMAQQIIERYGTDFTPDDVLRMWQNTQPKSAYFTAERVAYGNYAAGLLPPKTALYKNKYREFIGAQIRADYYGYICPGDPVRAAEAAYRDASASHIGNGVYGAMYVAAMLAEAAVTRDVPAIIRQGLAVIPRKSRLYARVSEVLRAFDAGETMASQIEALRAEYDEHTSYGWCHVIPNAVIVTLALLYGGGDFARSICLAVQSGYDTDCNGATVGSVVGMLCGGEVIPPEWKAPLGGKLATELVKVGTVEIETLVDRTLSHLR